MTTLLARLLRRLAPPGGWLPFLLLLTALLAPAAAMIESSLDVEPAALLILTPLAAISGLLLARSRLGTSWAALSGALLGLILTLIVVARLLPPVRLLWDEGLYALNWLRLWQRGMPSWPLPFASTAEFLGQRLYEFGSRLWWWGQTAAAGGTAQDPIFLVLLSAALGWAASFFATWQIYRRHAALVGLIPAGAAVAITAFFAGRMVTFYLLLYLFCTLWLIAICSLWTQTSRWEQTGIDYPGNMGLELVLSLSPWLILLILLAAIFPVIRPRQISDAFWRVAEGPWSTVEQLSEQLFGPTEGGFMAGRGSGAGGSLPRSHLLGAGPELTEMIVFYVKTSDPPPPPPDPDRPGSARSDHPRRYWRAVTFETYTGSGWANGALERQAVPPGQRLATGPASRQSTAADLRQQFELVQRDGPWLFAANEPLQVDRPVEAWWRAPGDLVQLTGEADRYTVLSRPVEPTVAELRAAPTTVPPEIAARYLALPERLPQRVLDLTVEVVADAGTQYDQARSIEAFLRTYTYTLDLPAPPADRDIVDYFLFDLQRGYCDYYASAMVVMARAAGLPARLASGYAQGSYDYAAQRWVVSEKEGHSWVEIHFAGLGWVEFEPTAGQPGLLRPGGSELAGIKVPPVPPRSVGPLRFPWTLLALGTLLVLLAAVLVAVWFWRPGQGKRVGPDDLIRDRYGRLLRWGARLDYAPHDGQTPHEYGQALAGALKARGERSRWARVRHAGGRAPSEVQQIEEGYTRAQYSADPPTRDEGLRIRELWRRLRRRLLWLWLGR